MKKYIALLRGINVGGNNKIDMAELKLLFETMGFTNVKTYINSGNIIFSSTNNNEKEIQISCEKAIKNRFKIDIPVLIISVQDFSNALENAPNWWDNDVLSKHNAIFVIPPVTSKEIIEQVGNIKQEYEQVYCYGNVFFWSAPIKTFSKTRWSKISSTKIYNNITIRNANTTKKLLEIAEKE